MIIKKISVRNFRNIDRAELSFGTGTTVFHGKNAEGKTNLLEAMYLPVTGRAFRTKHDASLIKYGEDFCDVTSEWEISGRKNTVSVRYLKENGAVQRAVAVNGVRITKLSELFGRFRAVLFSPGDLSLVTGGPGERRRFLDMAISSVDGAYLRKLQHYGKVLDQRNAMLREAQKKLRESRRAPDASVLAPWNELLAEDAAFISKKRAEYCVHLSETVDKTVSDMTHGKEGAGVRCRAGREKDEFLKQLGENPEAEVRAGMTLYGVHRDDLTLELNGRDGREFGSQGQQRTLALAMRISEGEIIYEKTGDRPVFLLDDLLIALDDDRRRFLLDSFDGKQVFVTSCENVGVGKNEALGELIRRGAEIIRVSGGAFEKTDTDI
ncbi:MAG: DNA replication and repair protein RecF [Clostridia bacterium]|nr:DNA replication and repair protein RecF [Clostridia bacterium]